jgi:hypothetical protein
MRCINCATGPNNCGLAAEFDCRRAPSAYLHPHRGFKEWEYKMKKFALAASAAFVIASGAMAMPASAADLDFFEPAPPPFIPPGKAFTSAAIGYGEARFRRPFRHRCLA